MVLALGPREDVVLLRPEGREVVRDRLGPIEEREDRMPLRIDTKVVNEVDVEGEKIRIRTLSGRERLKVLGHVGEVSDLLSNRGEDEEVSMSLTVQVQGLYFEILVLGLLEDPDSFDPRDWPKLVQAVIEANQLTGDDRKNSPSP
jgi:hypothetical protein